MIERFFTTQFTINKPIWKTDGDGNQYSELENAGSFTGHLQQASAILAQNLGLNFTKTYTIWCPIGTAVSEGDSLDRAVIDGEVQNEKQTISFDVPATSGSFTLRESAPIPWNATAEQIEEALELLLGEGNISVIGNLTDGLILEYINGLAGATQNLVVADTTELLSGSDPVVSTVVQTQEGGATPAESTYTVRAIQKNDIGINKHLELVVEIDQDNFVL